nr:hypothetical protein [Tanacetum cinerariifolium]
SQELKQNPHPDYHLSSPVVGTNIVAGITTIYTAAKTNIKFDGITIASGGNCQILPSTVGHCLLPPAFCLESTLRFVSTDCVLVLRFVAAFWLCVLLIEDSLAFCLGKTLPVSKLGCVLCQDFVAFCLEDFLRFVSRTLRFVSRLSCVLSQDLLRFASRLTAFCLQSVAFCVQASCVLSTFEDLF